NLVGNAVKFTPEGGTITIRAWDDGDILNVTVADTGIGISEEHRERVFERFMQVDASSTRAYGGMGVGLSLVKDLVEQHGGSVAVESDIGKGSIFTVRLPRGREHFRVPEASGEAWVPLTTNVSREALAGAESVSDDRVPELSVAEGAPTILVVDDTAEMRDAVRNVLSGFHVVTANDGVEGLVAAREHTPDLIISDVMMPRKDGHAFVQDLKSDPAFADTPVILLTAKVGEENLAAGFAAGADDYIVKPFQPKEVIARVTNLLKIQRQKRELEQMNQELKNIRQELIQSEKSAAVGVLAAGMAHELNNPVAAIRNYLQDILEELPNDSPYHDRIEGAERATERCKRIVADVLAFSQQGSTGEPCQINDLVTKTAEVAKRELLQPTMTLTTNLAADIPSSIVNPIELKQVLMNLLVNARDAIDGKGTITLTTRKTDGRICIEVRDTGSGIALEHQTKIFDPFFTTKPAGKGMGLGLALSSTMIKRAGGDLQVESQLGQGSCFRITLPITPSKASPASPKIS
ncbi:MAG: response regulator, partial [Deltaproteobacteria bacterium]|nr:response regulator [Deltaproteobacteria bacterium]